MSLQLVKIKFIENLPNIELIERKLFDHTNKVLYIKKLGSSFLISCSRFWSPVELAYNEKSKEIKLFLGRGIFSKHSYLGWVTIFILIRLGGTCDGFTPPKYATVKWEDLKWWQSMCIII